jgi:glycosyltransferase involved in cell wall biosynthesis
MVVDLGFIREPRLWKDILSFVRILWHFLLNRYDLVVVTTPKVLLLGSLAAFLTRQPRRVAFFQGRVYENFRGLRRKIYRLFDALTIACVHQLLFVSRSLKAEFVKELPVAARKAWVLGDGSGNGVCPKTFSPDNVPQSRISALRSELGIAASDRVVIVVGRLCRDKGLTEIADVVQRLADTASNIHFLLVGPVEDSEAAEQLQQLKGAGSVSHVDFVSDVVPYFALADVHLFLSHREGFGNVAIEAAAMGVPTIAFDVVGIRDSVAEGISGWRFPFGDTAAVADALRRFFDGALGVHQSPIDCRRWAIEQFNQKKVWESYAAFYELRIGSDRVP